MGRDTTRGARIGAALGLLALAATTACSGPGTPPPVTPPPTSPPGGGTTVGSTCEQYGSIRVQGGAYVVQNNNWGSGQGHAANQCISATSSGFTVTSGYQNVPTNGAPGSYPSIFTGCHYNNCSANSRFPAQYSSLGTVSSTVSITTAQGEWDAAYDIWFDPTNRRDGQNTGAEIMVWVNHQGRPQPVGSKVGTVNLAGATWDVWSGNIGWNVISYVRQTPATSFSGSLSAFANDAIARGRMQRQWYLTSVQFGFEPWIGGPGLGVRNFSVAVG